MSGTFRILFLLLFTLPVFSQPPAPDPADLSKLDFWVGEWNLSWQGGKGKNIIEKKLNGRVIQENFEITEGNNMGFTGISISTFNGADQQWHQAWADSNGGYFNFTGEMDGDTRIFKTTEPRILPNNTSVLFRMRFYDITEDSFMWDWERSTDGGKEWQLSWRIQYTRAQ